MTRTLHVAIAAVNKGLVCGSAFRGWGRGKLRYAPPLESELLIGHNVYKCGYYAIRIHSLLDIETVRRMNLLEARRGANH